MKRLLVKTAFIMILIFVLAAPGQAALEVRGTGTSLFGSYELIYDTDRNITWYDYSKYSDNWDDQMSWAADLAVTLNSKTYDDWRLPTAFSPEGYGPYPGYDLSSEMGHLYYLELGNGQNAGSLQNAGPFDQLKGEYKTEYNYYTGTLYETNPEGAAWKFCFTSGEQVVGDRYGTVLALAVRDGDVAISNPVPEPSTLLLLGFGLVGIIRAGRKFRK